MKTFNLKLALILLAIVVVSTVGVILLHDFQVSRTAVVFLDMAEESAEKVKQAKVEGDVEAETKALSKQIENLRWFFTLASDDPRALKAMEDYGMLMAENRANPQAYAAAVDTLSKVARRDETNAKVKSKLIELYMGGGKFNEAREQIGASLKKNPKDAEMLTKLGRCYSGMDKKKKEAKQAFMEAIKNDPHQVDAYFYFSLFLQANPDMADVVAPSAEGSGDEAATAEKKPENTPESLMAKMLEENPKSAKAKVNMCKYLLSQKGTEENRKAALYYAEEATKLDPEDVETLSLATQCSLMNGNYEATRKYAEQTLDREKENKRLRRMMYFFLFDAQMGEKEPEKALATLRKAYKELKDPYFLWLETDWNIDKGETKDKDLEKSIEEIAKRGFDDRGVAYLRGKIAYNKGSWLEAKTKLNQALPFFNDRPDKQKLLYYFIGQCHARLGNPDLAKRAYNQALECDSDFKPAVLALSTMEMQQNRVILPLPEILGLLKTNKDPNMLASLVSMAIATKGQKAPEDQNWKELEDILDGIEKEMPDLVQLPLFRCEILIAQKRYDEVEKTLRALLEKNPKSPDYWRALTIVGFNQNKLDQVEETLADFEKALGDTLELRLMKANYYLRRYGKDSKDRLLKLSENTGAFDDRQKNALWQTILGAMRQIGARDEVRRLTELMAERDPNNMQYLLMSFEQAVETDDLARMTKISDDIERLEGRGAYWYYSQAYLCISKVRGGGDPSLLDEALTDLDKAESKRGSWSKIPLLRGRVFDQKKDVTNALKYYQDAIGMGDYNTYAVIRVIQMLAQQNKVRDANAFLRRLDSDKIVISPELMQHWVSLMMNKEIRDYETALAKARLVMAAKPDDAKTAMWFGDTLGNLDQLTSGMATRKKDFDVLAPEMEKAYRRAVELAPAESDARVKLLLFLISTNRLSEAEKTLEEAKKHFVGVEGQLALGQCLMAMRHFEAAKEQFELALAADPKNAKVVRVMAAYYVLKSTLSTTDKAEDVKQAENLMHRIIEDKTLKVEKEDLFWARRSLAWIVLSREGYENVELARNLVGQNLKDDLESAPDLSLMASINSRDPKQSNRDLAIRAIRDLQADQKATSEDLYRLAELYLSKGDWPAASELFRGLAVSSIDNPLYVSRYIRELLDHGEVGDAEVFLRQMSEKWPNDVKTILLQSELMARSDKAEAALDLLKGFVDNPQSIPADRGQRMRLMALSLEDFCNRVLDVEQAANAKKYIQTAELYNKQYASEHPSAAMELANFYSRQNRPDDAVDVIEQQWQGATPKTLYESSMLATESGRGPKEIADRVLAILEQAKERFKDSPAIPLAMAGIKLGQGNYPEAEAIYHEILKTNPDHTTTLNNLAVMLTVSRKNLPEALEMIERAIRTAGPIAQMLDTRACVFIAMKEPEKALADMKDVLAAGKKAETLFHYAQALEIAGQSNAAAKAMQEALQMGLTEKSLMTPEVPTFKRLQEKADKLSPPKKQDKKGSKK